MFEHSGLPLEPFFNLSKDLLCIAGFDGYFKKVNPAVSELLGYTEEELYARPVNDFIHPDDRSRTSTLRNSLKTSKPLLNFENRYLTKSGDIIWLTWTSMPLKKEQLVYAIAKNITHVKKLEEDRNRLLTQFTQINFDLKQLSYRVSHDLRSPVSNLISTFSMMDESKIEDKELLEFISFLRTSTDNLNELLNQYLDTLSQEHHSNNKKQSIILTDVFEDVHTGLKSLIETSGATFEIDFTAFDQMEFNKSFMESIFLNMITNSIRYAHPERNPHITISTCQTGDSKQLIFSDNGIGFDMEKTKGKLFKINQTFADHKDSKGIGLHLVYNQITNMGGSITAEAKLNEGAAFTITF